jgi:hypothetical protein
MTHKTSRIGKTHKTSKIGKTSKKNTKKDVCSGHVVADCGRQERHVRHIRHVR